MGAFITWVATMDDNTCENCAALNGQVFTPDTLPGWPGDGSFGNEILCEGGPRCRCTLQYEDDSGNVAVGTSGLAEQWNLGTLQAELGPQGQIAQWIAGTSAFIASLPDVIQPFEVYSAQARAAMRFQVRQQLASELGVHPGDVPATMVADATPMAYKSLTGTIRIVHDMLAKNYPEAAIEWIGQMDWAYRDEVPLEEISVTGPSSESDAKSIGKKVKKIKKGKPMKPLILIDPGEDGLLQVADGHHRCAAALEADLTSVPAYVGTVHTDDDWRREVMDMQMVRAKKMHGTPGGSVDVIPPADTLNGEPDFASEGTGPTSQPYMSAGGLVIPEGSFAPGRPESFVGKAVTMVADPSDDPVAHHVKSFSLSSPLASGFVPFDLSGPEITVRFAGMLVMAADTGRVLMLQRALSEGDAAAGMWEIPGGHLEDDESPLDAAVREWSEEVGVPMPPVKIVGRWVSSNGYMGFLALCARETEIDIKSRSVVNPDDPDGDQSEAIAWFWPSDLASMPGVRQECRDYTPWSRIAVKVADK